MSPQRPPTRITVPDLCGKDGDTVRKTLQRMGFTDVSMSSTNPAYRVVMLESCWTAVGIEPPPGSVVSSDDPVVVRVYKE
ncbi:PASTA domain-containing protein [Mycobacterium bourgelatii]|uniref:PASTA domain-containing protein n=1 Tax=Mycobacterium bourgelatii TaxID=1273442 RepID=A0A7I9YHQ6_MYCBU|nr:hypothetical protein [Mycobacterium bourgelatii]MCV6976781.1 hypothetical protein [Mycobacterium bourgelatii]GFG88072.1 hypothetical protein MBOU_01140 [Mycobacterium bourgelatii]